MPTTTTKRPQIVIPEEGYHNADLARSRDRLLKGNTYRDCSTVCVVPAIAAIPPKVVQRWMGLMPPMNHRFTRIFVENMEVGDAYNAAVQLILGDPELSTWKYVLTLETDNTVPADALLKLIQDIETPIPGGGGGRWSAVGALYWTKGEGGQPMCYGKPDEMPKNFRPWLPPLDSVSECNGLGMGCTLFRLEMFKKLPPPWFRTVQEYTPGVGAKSFTQDLWAFGEFAKHGHRFACSTRVLSGHYDYSADMVW